MTDQKEFQKSLQRIEELVQAIESSADPNMRASAIELMQSLMELNSSGIERILSIVFESGPAGGELIDEIARDSRVESLLLLYGLHPLNIEERVLQALDKVRPYLESHGGNVELLNVNEGIVRLRLQGSCNGCASSAMTLKLAIEEAVYEKAPDLAALEVEGVVEETKPPAFVQLQRTATTNGKAKENGWKEVGELSSLAEGAVRAMEISDRPVIFCRIGETYYAYSDACPECGKTMQTALMEASALVCPGCRQRFDVRGAGRSLDKPDLYLEPFPLLMEQGQAKIALPVL
jgi:Fe-S cluster biogenesis protein NfuA/nitrite reductase/ring-hydroxylating ferredoxin subunit